MSPRRSRAPFALGLAVLVPLASAPARAQPAEAVSCFATGGGALEICRSEGEPQGVYALPPPCRFAYGVQILRLKDTGPPGPLQIVHHAEPPRAVGRGDVCPDDLRATDPSLGGTMRMGRQVEALATTMPPTEARFWTAGPESGPPARRRRTSRKARRADRQDALASAREAARMAADASPESGGARDPMTVAGRDWAGDPYYAVFMVATTRGPEGFRRVLIQGRTYDFQALDLRVQADPGTEWRPFGERGRRAAPPRIAPVLDEGGQPIAGHCAAPAEEARGLVGAISMVEGLYHYFYTDVLPVDCGAAPGKRRMGLYLRTARDPLAERAWSAATTVIEGLPPDTLMRLAKARGMDRWALAYTCTRPATAAGGPAADICLHYSADLSIGGLAGMSLFAEPVAAGRSPAYLGLRIGGDSLGRFGRDGFSWMTDRYGNLDVPSIYPRKGGFLTWLDRRGPRADGRDHSNLYGRPLYWATWTVRPRPAAP